MAKGKRRVPTQYDRERLRYSFRLRMLLADGILRIGTIVSFAVPGFFVWKTFETFGGKTTTFSVSLITKVSVAITALSIGAVVMAWAKMQKQRQELIRGRERNSELEKRVRSTGSSEKKQ